MRLDPASAAAARWLAWRAAAGLLLLAALFAVATLVPLQIYKPSCGRDHPLLGRPKIDGPLRPEYVEMFTRLMREEGFRFWRIGNTVLVPVLPVFDGSKLWNWADFTLNWEWRVARSVVNGYTARGCAPPPEAVRRLHGDIPGTCGRPVERSPDGWIVPPPPFWISDDCNLFRAAVIRVEDMPQPLRPLEGPIVLRERWPGPAWTEPAPQRR